MRNIIKNKLSLWAVTFVVLLLCSCNDNKRRTFCKSEGVVSYDIKKDSDFMVISEKWNNPRFDKKYKLQFINGEYYLDVNGSKKLFLSTKRFVRKNSRLKNSIGSINIDKYRDTTFMTAIVEEMPNSKLTTKLIYYNKSYHVFLIQNFPVLEDFTVGNRPMSFSSRHYQQDSESRTLISDDDNVISYDVIKDADSIVIYENKVSNINDRKYRFVYKNGEYFWDNEEGKEMLVMSIKKETNEEYSLPQIAMPYRVSIKHAQGAAYITSIYTEGPKERLTLRLYYDKSYNINKIQMEDCIGFI